MVFFGLLALMFIGCSNTPQKAVENMYDALNKGDLSKLLKNTTEPMSGAFAAMALRECSVDKEKYKADDLKLVETCMLELYSNLSVKKIKLIKEDGNSAQVEAIIKNNSIESTVNLSLIKVDREWRVTTGK